MKSLSIGRDPSCDIVINDVTNVVSRRHAILTITDMGKMTIMDQSTNGTYVNGMRISSGVPVPVTRKDIISFEHVAKLDWSRVPSPMRDNLIRLAAVIGGVVILALIIFTWINRHKGDDPKPINPQETMVVPDTSKTKQSDEKEKQEKQEQQTEKKKEEKKDTVVVIKVVEKPQKKDTTKAKEKQPVAQKPIL